jgi:hypothetical protein
LFVRGWIARSGGFREGFDASGDQLNQPYGLGLVLLIDRDRQLDDLRQHPFLARGDYEGLSLAEGDGALLVLFWDWGCT